MENTKDLRSTLRVWKNEAGIRSSEIARRMGVTRGVVCRIEHNPENSRVRTIARYAEACGVEHPVIFLKGGFGQ